MPAKILKSILLLIPVCISLSAAAQNKCCDVASCREQASEYALKITGLVAYLGKYDEGNPAANDNTLKELETNYKNVYDDFIRTAKAIANLYIDNPKLEGSQVCFIDALPKGTGSNVMAWINHINDKKSVFPFTEFCGGFKKRIEIGQGASAFLSKTKMAYLGAAKAYLIYTFSQKNKCGGRFRLLAGPGFFLQNATSYVTISSRLGIRITDLKASVFSLGNLNFFGGYTSNFDRFNFAEAGLEAELGWFGVNISANYNTTLKKGGFLVGLILANKKMGKK